MKTTLLVIGAVVAAIAVWFYWSKPVVVSGNTATSGDAAIQPATLGVEDISISHGTATFDDSRLNAAVQRAGGAVTLGQAGFQVDLS